MPVGAMLVFLLGKAALGMQPSAAPLRKSIISNGSRQDDALRQPCSGPAAATQVSPGAWPPKQTPIAPVTALLDPLTQSALPPLCSLAGTAYRSAARSLFSGVAARWGRPVPLPVVSLPAVRG